MIWGGIMEIFNQYKAYIVPILSVLFTILSVYVKSVKYEKSQKISKAEIELNHILLMLMAEAEKYINYSGEEKRAYVLTRVKEIFLNKKLSMHSDLVEEKIESYIQLSKNVNYIKKQAKLLKNLHEDNNNDQ